MNPITTESATVFRAAGRRWFTKAAACRAAARAKIRSKCECEKPDADYSPGTGYPGMICGYHKDQDRYGKLVRRLARFYVHMKLKEEEPEPEADIKPIAAAIEEALNAVMKCKGILPSTVAVELQKAHISLLNARNWIKLNRP